MGNDQTVMSRCRIVGRNSEALNCYSFLIGLKHAQNFDHVIVMVALFKLEF